MDYLYGDAEIHRRVADAKWYTPYIKGYPMVRLGEFCKEFGLTIDCTYDSYSDVSTLSFRRYSTLGKAGARYSVPCNGINFNNIFNIEDMIIKRLSEDFDIKEALLYMRIPRYGEKCNNKPEIKKVIFSGPCTIVLWSDGDKTIVRCGKNDVFDKEKGLAMAISKKMLGTNNSKSSYYDVFKEYIQEKKEA